MVLVSGCRAQRDLNNTASLSLSLSLRAPPAQGVNSKRVSSPGAGERQGSGFKRKKKTLV